MNNKETIHAVSLMRDIRNIIAEEEKGLSWEERKMKIRRDLEATPLWKRLKGEVRVVETDDFKVKS